MAQYVLTLSPADKEVEIDTIGGDGSGREIVISRKRALRDIEKMMLRNLLEFAANSYKENSKIFLCVDLRGQISDLEDQNNDIVLDNADRENLETGVKLTENKRPFLWYECRDLWRQLRDWPQKKGDS